MTVMERLAASIVVPVVVLDKAEDAIPTAKAMSVDIGIPIPSENGVPRLISVNIIAGNKTPPIAAIIGNEAFLKLDNLPCSISLFISRPTNKKNIAIKKSFIIR